MSETTLEISCSIGTTDPLAGLELEILLDDQVIFPATRIINTINFTHNMSDADGQHCLEFVMKNKTTEHTTIDQQGNIVKDACLIISNLAFDQIELKQIFIDQAVYTHNFNGTRPETQDKFYDNMGCNGRVNLNFTTPMYLWLLENM
jgi:hypothetical protein